MGRTELEMHWSDAFCFQICEICKLVYSCCHFQPSHVVKRVCPTCCGLASVFSSYTTTTSLNLTLVEVLLVRYDSIKHGFLLELDEMTSWYNHSNASHISAHHVTLCVSYSVALLATITSRTRKSRKARIPSAPLFKHTHKINSYKHRTHTRRYLPPPEPDHIYGEYKNISVRLEGPEDPPNHPPSLTCFWVCVGTDAGVQRGDGFQAFLGNRELFQGFSASFFLPWIPPELQKKPPRAFRFL